jgi:hypothetical protein
MEVKYKNCTLNVPESLDELTLGQFLNYYKIANTISEENTELDNLLNTYKIIESITGANEETIDSLLIEEVNDLAIKLSKTFDQTNFKKEADEHMVIDGVDYVAKSVNEIDNGEYISLNILREQYKNDIDLFPRLLAILVRPGKKEFDPERNEETWTIEKFNRRDINNLELRAKKFLEKGRAKDLIPVVNFFLTTNEE